MRSQLSLWETQDSATSEVGQKLAIPNAEVILFPNAFSFNESCQLYNDLLETIAWKQESTVLFNREVSIPRLTAWYGEPGKSYTYSNITMEPAPWNEALLVIKSRIEAIAHSSFNSVLLNLYRSGKDSIAWHSDDEPELGKNPVIASVSFGETRRFMLRHKFQKELRTAIDLTHGSLLLMQGTTQHFWQHQVPKTNRAVEPRINLTFRQIV